MAATSSGALKAYIEAAGLSLSAYRDAAPSKPGQERRLPNVPMPYVTIREAVAVTVNRDGDLSDPNAALTVQEVVAVDLWQQWRTPEGKPAEDYTLPGRLLVQLRGARLVPVGASVVYGVTGVSMVRLLEEESNVVHHAYTLTIHRAA